MVAGLTTLKNGFDKGASFAKSTLDSGLNLAASSFKTSKTLASTTLNTSQELAIASFNTGKSFTKTGLHEVLSIAAKVIDASNKALDSTVSVGAGYIVVDTVLNGSIFVANNEGTNTYKLLNKLEINNAVTNDKGLVQSLQIPAAIFAVTVGLPLVSGALNHLKGYVVRLDAAIPR